MQASLARPTPGARFLPRGRSLQRGRPAFVPRATPQDVDAWVRQGLISDQEAKSFSPTQLDFLVQKRGSSVATASPSPAPLEGNRASLERSYGGAASPSSRPRPSYRPSSSPRPAPASSSSHLPAPSAASSSPAPLRPSSAPRRAGGTSGQKSHAGRWRGMDADVDMSDDQQDITRGRNMVDSVFQGNQGMGGTHNAILSSHDYISTAMRSLGNIEDGYYIAPAFLDKMAIHIAKNFMDLPKIKVPLILGIWGGKGQGKTFQCNLAYKKLGISPIVMSAGELESGNAGEPAKLIRQRYREASDIIKKGKMASLFINDLDAGAGRMGDSTQYTVNNQMVNATLMNIADNPTNVQLPGVYKNDEIPRVPIVCTGNDFSTLYAPLIRDGRMEKYYWNPTREDRVGVCMGIFQHDGIGRADVEQLVDAFPGQSIDFFGALRARVYDDSVRDWIAGIGVEAMGKRLVNSKEGKVEFEKPAMSLPILMKYGNLLVEEQENVKRVQLADEYMSGAALAGSTGSSLPEGYSAY